MKGNFSRGNVEISKLNMRQPYNRDIKETRSRKMAENYKNYLVKPIDISLRQDNKYYVIDGQHRVTMLNFLNIESVDATIHLNLTYEEEALMFVELNANSKNVSAGQKFIGLLEGRNPEALDIINILSQFNFCISIEKVKSLKEDNFGKIECVDTIQKLYNKLERDMFIRILDVISKTWGGHYHSLKRNILMGVALFIKEYGYEISNKDIVVKWKNHPAIDIIRDARSTWGMTDNNSFKPYAKELLRIYNSGKTEKNRLPDRLDLTVLDKKSKRISNENQNESGFEVYSPMSAKSKDSNTIHFN
jgi:hypothetical protein